MDKGEEKTKGWADRVTIRQAGQVIGVLMFVVGILGLLLMRAC